MTGLTDRASGETADLNDAVERAHQAWQVSMLRQLDELRNAIHAYHPERLAARCGASYEEGEIRFEYWGKRLSVTWPSLLVRWHPDGSDCSIFDTGMILYYLRIADGAPLAERWVGYRELPGGGFYFQAFQGYSGDRLAHAYGNNPESFVEAANKLNGIPLTTLPGYAFAFLPFPRIRLAAILYPGDDEFQARAVVLFDASASHYMTIDGLALLGAGLAGRLEKQSMGDR